MRRHAAFVPLSRDHHAALVLARGLLHGADASFQRSLPADLAARAMHVVRVFREDLDPHFRCEEDVLLAPLRGRDAELDRVCDEVLTDHTALRAMIAELAERPSADTLDAFGRRLDAHVRLEERALFETAQRVVPDDELTRLAALVERSRRR